MKQRQLGTGGASVGAIGLGAMQMALPAMRGGRLDPAEGVATIHAALDAGISFINTGDFYGAGASEMIVGAAIRDRRDRAFVSVKFGGLRSRRVSSSASTAGPTRSRTSVPIRSSGWGSRRSTCTSRRGSIPASRSRTRSARSPT